MKIYPAIDIRNGKAVRLLRGDYNKETVYDSDPLTVALGFFAKGASHLHLVDLDGAASGNTDNRALIERIVGAYGAFVEIGGGIRTLKAAEDYVNSGAKRIILGSAAYENPRLLANCLDKLGDKVAVGVDAINGLVAIHGWKTVTDLNAFEFCDKLYSQGVKTVIYTDISKDGAMCGPNFEAYNVLAKTNLNIIASGGVSSLDDLARLKTSGVFGAILGKSLYEGAIDLTDALKLED